jgi:galactose-1-phosphate uridylyltransferase
MVKNKIHLNFSHVHDRKQELLMRKIKKDGVCPFCKENFEKYHPKPILKKGRWWIVTENMAPYKGTKKHLIFVYLSKHATKIEEINTDAGKELIKLLSWVIKKYKIKGCGLFMRSGDTNRTGSSVEHLHAQLVAGNSTYKNKNSSSLKIKLGYKKEKKKNP